MFGFELKPLPGTQLFAVECAPDVDRDGIRKTNREGVAQSYVDVMVRAAGRRTQVARVKVPGDVQIPPFCPVHVEGLMEHNTVIDGRPVTWTTADSIAPVSRAASREAAPSDG